MFLDMGSVSAEECGMLRQAAEPWMAGLLASEEYAGWLAECGGEIVAGGGVFLLQLGPGPGRYRLGRWAHVANVYTERTHRRRGLARRLMQTILEWCAANAIDQVTLATSDEGRPLYESLGFKPTTADMRLEAKS
jgi:GNAT superfamily N-acetyltransferase